MNEAEKAHNAIRRKLRKSKDREERFELLYYVYANMRATEASIEDLEKQSISYKKIIADFTDNVSCPRWMLPDDIISIMEIHDEWCDRNKE